MKVLTWNLNCEDNYRERLSGIIQLVKDQDPDIIAFQEVLYGSYDLIVNEFPEYNYFLDNKVQYNRLYGEIILTKYQILESCYVPFSNSPNIRGITCYKHEDFHVITTHLENKDTHNSRNTKELVDFVENNNIKNFVMLGDFNYYDSDGKLNYPQVYTENTYQRDYDSRPDRIYYSNFEPQNPLVLETNLSDHYPIVVNLFVAL